MAVIGSKADESCAPPLISETRSKPVAGSGCTRAGSRRSVTCVLGASRKY